jgi:hypothetical protein
MPVLDAIPGSRVIQGKPYKLMHQIPAPAAEMIVEHLQGLMNRIVLSQRRISTGGKSQGIPTLVRYSDKR